MKLYNWSKRMKMGCLSSITFDGDRKISIEGQEDLHIPSLIVWSARLSLPRLCLS